MRITARRRARLVAVALVLLSMAGIAPVAAAPGDFTPGVSTVAGGRAVPPHHVAFDAQGRGWFTALARRVAPGSVADRQCSTTNAQRTDGYGCGRVGRFAAGQVTYSSHPDMDEPFAVVPHIGGVFVSDRSENVIWRVTPAGGVRVWVKLYANRALIPTELLAVGQRIWFVASDWNSRTDPNATVARQRQTGRIGWFDPRNPGVVRSWRVSNLRRLSGLSLDASGRLWFAAAGVNGAQSGFGRLDPRVANPGATLRTYTRAQLGASNISSPVRLERGADNRLWFINNGSSTIGRFAPANPVGTITSFGANTGGGDLYDLIRGPDGAIWFTESTEDRLGRISTTGEMNAALPTVPFDQPWGIARRGNRLYVAAASSSAIPSFEP
jgi:streptogramin lyase